MAAVATRPSATNSPHLGNKSMTSSPRTRSAAHNQEAQKKESAANQDVKLESSVPTINPPEDNKDIASVTNAPLAPPPKPTQNGDTNDYFSGTHNQSHLAKEPNPFENAFGNPAETPGKTQLPGVTSLTSPSSLLPGNTPGWAGSLRSGPLSPAMLTGPTGTNDYFSGDHHFAGSFPTPNESSLRTGLTPGGGGSMFPQPSPNSQALYNQLQSGGATPGTLDFHRTAMTARAQTQAGSYTMPGNGVTSNPPSNPNIQPDLDVKPFQPGNPSHVQDQDPFGTHQTNDAANGLYMLAQATGQQRGAQPAMTMPQQPPQPYPPTMQQEPHHNKRASKHSIASTMSGSPEQGLGEYSDGSAEAKPQTRSGRGKKNTGGKAANGKRKTDETPSKASGKRQRGSNGQVMPPDEPEDDDMDDEHMDEGVDGKKMTDEEKRKNFLERNRIAALKCRQRKKQWLANLQQKVEIFSTENDALAATVTQLREEIVGLKTLLLAHKDCPVSQAQGISGMAMQQLAGDAQHYANPYGMAMGPGGPGVPQAGMQRR